PLELPQLKTLPCYYTSCHPVSATVCIILPLGNSFLILLSLWNNLTLYRFLPLPLEHMAISVNSLIIKGIGLTNTISSFSLHAFSWSWLIWSIISLSVHPWDGTGRMSNPSYTILKIFS